jgi:hypothetical protein
VTTVPDGLAGGEIEVVGSGTPAEADHSIGGLLNLFTGISPRPGSSWSRTAGFSP